MSVYERQSDMNLNTNVTVSIAGIGGIGWWATKFLAMSGVPKLYLYDIDVFEEHNLNRIDITKDHLGRNKAEVAEEMVDEIRDDCMVSSYPFKLNANTFFEGDWILDCTDRVDAQEEIFNFAKSKKIKYLKAGYDGIFISLRNTVAQWGVAPDGYTIIPSYVCPAVSVASLAVHKILTNNKNEISSDLDTILKDQ